jgi:hypothetical protein
VELESQVNLANAAAYITVALTLQRQLNFPKEKPFLAVTEMAMLHHGF